MPNYIRSYSKQLSRRYRTKQTAKQKKKMGKYSNFSPLKLARDVQEVKRMLNVEHKMVATNYGTNGSTANPSI